MSSQVPSFHPCQSFPAILGHFLSSPAIFIDVAFSTYLHPFTAISAMYSHFGSFWVISSQSSLVQPAFAIFAISSLFQPIPANSSLLQPVQPTLVLLGPTNYLIIPNKMCIIKYVELVGCRACYKQEYPFFSSSQ